jgi:hypothetical protein
MFHHLLEDVVRFGTSGDFGDELAEAKVEYIDRTGELFESDANFERRMTAFLEWFALERVIGITPYKTPVALFIEQRSEALSTLEKVQLEALRQSMLSLFEFQKQREGLLDVRCLITGEKYQVAEGQKILGLSVGDYFESRLVAFAGKTIFSDTFCVFPEGARPAIAKAIKRLKRKPYTEEERLNLIHRVAFFSHRSERYKHVDPKQIFEDL